MWSVLARRLRGIIPDPIYRSLPERDGHDQSAHRCMELATIHAKAPVALLLVDEELQVEKVNQLAAQLVGRDTPDILSPSSGPPLGCLHALADPNRCGAGPSCIECPFRKAVLDTVKLRKRQESVEAWVPVSNGYGPEQRCFLISTTPLAFDQRQKALVCAQEITDLKRTEANLRQTVAKLEADLASKTVLLQEVHHRVKNNLAVISSVLNMNAETIVDGPAKAALEESQRRVNSIALIHEHLYGSANLEGINFADYVRQLVQALYSTFAVEPARIAISIHADPVDLGVAQAVPAALILNELVSNAFKHAFPGQRRGTIQVTVRRSESGGVELAVEDDGVGSADVLAERKTKSVGLQIVGILAAQLGGSVKHEPGAGTRMVLRFLVGAARRAGR